MSAVNPVDEAIRVMLNFHSVYGSKCGSGEAIARRLKELPQIILQAGLVPALTFYASKLDDERKRNAYSAAIKAAEGGGVEGDYNSICEGATGEGGGYPQALALVMTYLARLAGCQEYGSIGKGFLECLNSIEKRGVLLERLAETYVIELKKLATALYEEEKSKKQGEIGEEG